MMPPTDNNKLTKEQPPHLLLEIGEIHAKDLARLLQNGFFLPNVKIGINITEFLREELGLKPEYIRGRIQSLFLDGKPVDDYDTTHIRNCPRLALSSALPGLVGATLRQGGLLSSFRRSITYRDPGINETGRGTVQLKLFNMIMEELGPPLLLQGILVRASDLRCFLLAASDMLWHCTKILFNGDPKEVDVLLDNNIFDAYDIIKLSVRYSIERG